MTDLALSRSRLHHWARFAERDWYDIPHQPGRGCYGTGYNSWGVQTNQKYVGALATLATEPDVTGAFDQAWALDRALASLRFSLHSHHANGGRCTDNTSWGHTWISPLGIERMLHGLYRLEPHLTDADREALRHMLVSEATWHATSHKRGAHTGVHADRWNTSGRNNPESNLWAGALLWRAAKFYGDHPDAAQWTEAAHRFMINGISVPDDETNDAIVAGRPVKDRFVGGNFFPHYALDHHGYLNVGYMVMCLCHIAILHFELRMKGVPAPESLHHHAADLWQVVRRMLFADGRLARLGGDTRVRYTYCQEYLLPPLLYAADHLGDSHALSLLQGQLDMIHREADYNGDGSFYSRRLTELARANPYYYTRLESDRAAVLAMLLSFQPLVNPPQPASTDFESTVAGTWIETEHGSAMHRCPTRLASFAWRAYGRAQGLCLPPDDGHLAEWQHNMAGAVRWLGDVSGPGDVASRDVRHDTIEAFEGGFVTCGMIMEGINLRVPEGWTATDGAEHHLALAALPDSHTVVALQHIRNGDKRLYLTSLKGLCYNVPNDPVQAHVGLGRCRVSFDHVVHIGVRLELLLDPLVPRIADSAPA